MGAYLEKPVVEIEIEAGAGDFYEYAAASMQGWRVKQEDAHSCVVDFDEEKGFSLFGVYDGHGGPEVSNYCAERLPVHIYASKLYREGKLEEALRQGFLSFDALLKQEEAKKRLGELAESCGGNCTNIAEEGVPEDFKDLFEEASMPLDKVIAKYKMRFMSGEGSSGDSDAAKWDQGGESKPSKFLESIAVDDLTFCQPSDMNGKDKSPDHKKNQLVNGQVKSKMDEDADKLEDNSGGGTGNDGDSEAAPDTIDKSKKGKSPKKSPSKAEDNSGGGTGNDGDSEAAPDTIDKSKKGKSPKKSPSKAEDNSGGGTGNDGDSEAAPDTIDKSKKGKSPKKSPSKAEDNSGGGTGNDGDSEAAPDTLEESKKGKSHGKSTGENSDKSPVKKRFSDRLRMLKKDSKDLMDEDATLDSTSSSETSDESTDDSSDGDDELEEDGEDEDGGEDSSWDTVSSSSDDECGMSAQKKHYKEPIEVPGVDSGTTAVVALLAKDKVIVANVGDSRAILGRVTAAVEDGKESTVEAIELSFDHKPEHPEERDRVEKAGGYVDKDGRVNGGLNLSRAIGDHVFKNREDLPPEKQKISPMPDIIAQTLLLPEDDKSGDQFVFIACDGIWNDLSSQQAAEFIWTRMSKNVPLDNICKEMFQQCLAPNTHGDGTGCDNMTAVLIRLRQPSQAKKEPPQKRSVESHEDDAKEHSPPKKFAVS